MEYAGRVMSSTTPHPTLTSSFERIEALLAELRQTEALEAQIHEMVVMKRERLATLLAEHMSLAAGAEVVPVPKAQVAVKPVEAPVVPAAPVDLPLSTFGAYGAPKDLLQGRPAPSAQHVLDSLNRLMTGISSKQSNAA